MRGMWLASGVLAVAGAALPAAAITHEYDGHHRRAFDRGFERGYREGLEHGAKDTHRDEDYNFWHDRRYRKGDAGYRFWYGPRYEYQAGFRRGYEEGYRRAYASYGRGYGGRYGYERAVRHRHRGQDGWCYERHDGPYGPPPRW